MKINVKVVNSIVERRQYVDTKTGNTRDRYICTLGGTIGTGEMVSCVIYGDSEDAFKTVPKSGNVMVDCYKYESTNALMGSIWARSVAVER